MPGDAREMPGDAWEMPGDSREMPGDSQGMLWRCRGMPGYAREMPGDVREMLGSCTGLSVTRARAGQVFRCSSLQPCRQRLLNVTLSREARHAAQLQPAGATLLTQG